MSNKFRSQILRVAASGIIRVAESVKHNSGMRNELFNIANRVNRLANGYASSLMEEIEELPENFLDVMETNNNFNKERENGSEQGPDRSIV